jgi:glycosyltransferase involved in cell wall biosynthesis
VEPVDHTLALALLWFLDVRIAQVSPLYESVPPTEYGGTERVVSFLTEELVRLGHDVTLFASGDSATSARLVPMTPRALRSDPGSVDPVAQHFVMLERVARAAETFDILHYHVDYLHFPISRRLSVPHVTTLHGHLDAPDLQPLYDEYGDIPVVSISDEQRTPLPRANWCATVHHGLPADLLSPGQGRGDYLVFLGRVSRQKRADRAIEIARKAGAPLRIAAKIDESDQPYFDKEIAPLFDLPFVDYLGEVGDDRKAALLGDARALLFPIDWREPFGLVMIEAMACGTPTIAWDNGSVREIISDGVTGFIVDSIDAAVEAVTRLPTLSRDRIRAEFERRFTVERMAADYLALYDRLIRAKWRPQPVAERVTRD